MISMVNTPVMTKIENSQTPGSRFYYKTTTGENVPIASADSKESDQTAYKSLQSVNPLNFLRITEAIISLR